MGPKHSMVTVLMTMMVFRLKCPTIVMLNIMVLRLKYVMMTIVMTMRLKYMLLFFTDKSADAVCRGSAWISQAVQWDTSGRTQWMTYSFVMMDRLREDFKDPSHEYDGEVPPLRTWPLTWVFEAFPYISGHIVSKTIRLICISGSDWDIVSEDKPCLWSAEERIRSQNSWGALFTKRTNDEKQGRPGTWEFLTELDFNLHFQDLGVDTTGDYALQDPRLERQLRSSGSNRFTHQFNRIGCLLVSLIHIGRGWLSVGHIIRFYWWRSSLAIPSISLI